MNILIVEDESSIREELVRFLTRQRYTVGEAADYRTADEKLDLYGYDCLVVDIMLPDGDGLDLIRKVKKAGLQTGIIVISARGTTEEKIVGLESGADDYLAKPFSLAELHARICAVIRRRSFGGRDEFVFHELKLLPATRQVFVGRTELMLTPKEYDLLVYFLTNRGRVLSKENIVEHLWGDAAGLAADSFDFIYTHIRNLRTKLTDAGARDYIRTVYAVGYRFTDEAV